MLTAEVRRQKQRNELLARSPAEKRKADVALWTAWLARYRSRIFFGDPSSEHAAAVEAARVALMRSVNPVIVLHNDAAQLAIELAEAGDFGGVRATLAAISTPFQQPRKDCDDNSLLYHLLSTGVRAGTSRCTKVSCSS